jgi:WD40 repeat protein
MIESKLNSSKNRLAICSSAVAQGLASFMMIALNCQLSSAQPLPPIPEKNPEDIQFTAPPPLRANLPWQNVSLKYTLKGHKAAIDSLVFSQDSKFLISGGSYNDPLIRFWWLKTGKEVENVRAQRMAVIGMILTPNGKNLVTAGQDAAINVWNWDTKKYTATFLEHSNNIMSLAVSPDSEVLVSGALDGVKVWNLKMQRPIYTLAGVGTPIYSVAIHPGGYILAGGGDRGKVKFWNLKTGELISEFTPHYQPISQLAFTPDGELMVTASYDRSIKVWNYRTGKLLYTLIGHTGKIRAIAISPDGETLASCSNDGVRLWNIRTGQLLNRLEDHQDWVNSLAFSPDGRMLAGGGYAVEIKIWENISAIEK